MIEADLQFGKWTVLGKASRPHYSLCQCACGTVREVYNRSLKIGTSASCGCKQKENPANLIHGESRIGRRSRLYRIWANMKDRCSNQDTPSFDGYGARGIQVCIGWQEFIPFRDWAMSSGYSERLQIDRIDNNGNYEPSNCRWVTPAQNSTNKRNTRLITAFGETKHLSAWTRDPRCKVSHGSLIERLAHSDMTTEEALTKPPRPRFGPSGGLRPYKLKR